MGGLALVVFHTVDRQAEGHSRFAYISVRDGGLMLPTGLAVLQDELIQAGYVPGTPVYESALLAKKVERCRSLLGVQECESCSRYDYCETVKAYLMDKKYNRQETRKALVVDGDRLPDWMIFGRAGDEHGDTD